jgi:hypothetical protein
MKNKKWLGSIPFAVYMNKKTGTTKEWAVPIPFHTGD